MALDARRRQQKAEKRRAKEKAKRRELARRKSDDVGQRLARVAAAPILHCCTTQSLVELDLLRGGERLPMAGPLPPGDYFAFIGRSGKRPNCEVVGWSFRAPLPTINIPLLPPDPDLPLDLQAVFSAAYEPAFYDRRLRYDQPLTTPLSPVDETWVKQALPTKS